MIALSLALLSAQAANIEIIEGVGVAGVELGMTPAEVAASVQGVAWFDDAPYDLYLTSAGALRVLYQGDKVVEITAYPTTLDTDQFVTRWGGVATGGIALQGNDQYGQPLSRPGEVLRAYGPGLTEVANPVDFGVGSNSTLYRQWTGQHPNGSRMWFTFVQVDIFGGYGLPGDVAGTLEVTLSR